MARGGGSFENATAIVTGGASGIGRALAEALAARGCAVVIADRQGELAEEAAAALRTTGGEARAAEVDVRDPESVERVVDEAYRRAGRLDYLFNNAGIAVAGEVHRHGLEDWNAIVDVNLRGVIHGVQAAYPRMLEQGSGHIVNTASMAGLLPAPGLASYGTTKHAVVGLSRSLRIEAAPAGVRVSVLCPGVIRTPIFRGGRYGRLLEPFPEPAQEEMFERMRPMEPRPFAERVLDQVARNRALIIVPGWWKLFWWLDRLSPALGERMNARFYTDIRRRLESSEQERAAPS